MAKNLTLTAAVGCWLALATTSVLAQQHQRWRGNLVAQPAQTCQAGGKVVTVSKASQDEHGSTLVEIAASDPNFSTLVAAVKAAGLVETLSGKGPLTVFAPTNAAFAKLPKETLEALLKPENRQQLTAILTYHVVPGKVMAADVVKLSQAKSAQGATIDIAVKDGKVVLNESSRVIQTDIQASNGVIHVIDSVILPPEKSGQTIVEIAAANEDFSTLVAAVKAAGLVETLAGKGPFTVFAPTNAAFAKLPPGTVADLLKPENKQALVSVLSYHVVPGKVMAADVVGLKAAKSVQGSSISITVDGSDVLLNSSAKVVVTDIAASNGVIHVIDSVILPPRD